MSFVPKTIAVLNRRFPIESADYPNGVKLPEDRMVLGCLIGSDANKKWLYMDKVSHRVTGVTLEDGVIDIEMNILDTEFGRKLLSELEAGSSFTTNPFVTESGYIICCHFTRASE